VFCEWYIFIWLFWGENQTEMLTWPFFPWLLGLIINTSDWSEDFLAAFFSLMDK